MRARSGAIHCDNEQDFVQLAEAAQNNTGIFYDELINRKVMKQLQMSKKTQPQEKIAPLTPPEKTKKDLFANFDFTQEGAFEREEKQFVTQYKCIKANYNIGCICKKTGQIMKVLSSRRGAKEWPDRTIDLLVWVQESMVCKLWLFEEESIHENAVIQLYYDQCMGVIRVEEGEPVKKISGDLDQMQDIIEKISRKLQLKRAR